MHRRKNTWGRREKTVIYTARREASKELACSHLGVQPPPGQWEGKFLLLESPSLWGFVIAAPANEYTCLLPITRWLNHVGCHSCCGQDSGHSLTRSFTPWSESLPSSTICLSPESWMGQGSASKVLWCWQDLVLPGLLATRASHHGSWLQEHVQAEGMDRQLEGKFSPL